MDNLWTFVKPCTGKMSRKRFVKLCMGRLGFSRNVSNLLASIAQLDSYSYKMDGLTIRAQQPPQRTHHELHE